MQIQKLIKTTLLSIFLIQTVSNKITAFSGTGAGTENDAFQITTCTQLQEMQDDLDAYYELAEDIDCSASSGWNWAAGAGLRPVGGMFGGPPTPAGATQDTGVTTITGAPAYSFQGNLDGQNYTISDLYIESGVPYSGLFGVTNGATIQNLNIDSSTNNNSSSTQELALLVGYAKDTTISNCNISGVVTTPQGYNGLIVGHLDEDSSITDSTATFNSQIAGGTFNFAGLAGYISNNTSIDNSSVSGTLTTAAGDTSYSIACLVGAAGSDSDVLTTASITDSHSDCTINNPGNSSYNIGGLVGYTRGALAVSDSYFEGSINDTGSANSTYGVASIIGVANGATIENSYSTGSISLKDDGYSVGGLVGQATATSISSSYFTGSISLDTYYSWIGGLVGRADTSSSITDSYSTATITGTDDNTYIGGLAGQLNASSVTSSYSTGNINLATYATFLGGLVGQTISNSDISKSYYKGNIVATDDATFLGGLIGQHNNSSIDNSYVNASLTAGATTTFWGGGIGRILDSTVTNSYASTTISLGSGETNGGGLLGAFDGSDSSSIFSSSYWDQTKSGVGSSAAGTAYTTAQMKIQNNFTGWDFDNIWAVDSGTNDGYPFIGTAPTVGEESSETSESNSEDEDSDDDDDDDDDDNDSDDDSDSEDNNNNGLEITDPTIIYSNDEEEETLLTEEEEEALEIADDEEIPQENISDEDDIGISVDDDDIEEGEDEIVHVYEDEEVEIVIPTEIIQPDEEEKEIENVYAILGEQIETMTNNVAEDNYQTIISTKGLEGKQEIKIVTFFEDGEAQKQSFDLLVDPHGYVYYLNENGQEIRVEDAEIKVYEIINGEKVLYELNSKKGHQITNKDGEYSYYVEAGEYVITVEKEGFNSYESEVIEIKSNLIGKKIELKIKGVSTASGTLMSFDFMSIINSQYCWIYISILVIIILLIIVRKILKEEK